MADRHVEFALIGGGNAAASCAMRLRREGADGAILLIGREPDLPYDRPPCSKEYLRGSKTREQTLLHTAEEYAEQDIEVLTRVSAMKLDPGERTIKLSNKQEVSFDRALLASGANVRRLNADGAQLEGIHYLRTLGNADAIREDTAGKRVVLVGGSYIGTELAASLTELGCTCTIVMLEPVVLSRGFGEQAGRYFQTVLEDHGVTVHGGQELDRFEGAGERVTHVHCKSGLAIEADAVVIGVGAMPDVMLARSAGLELGPSGGVTVDTRLHTSAPGIYAAGDVAEYESVVHDGHKIRIEHWDVAFQQGKVAALNMLGRDTPYDVVPYFFSDLSDWASLEYVGPAADWDREIVRGSLDDGAFSVWYLEGDRVRAALSSGRSDDLQAARRMIADGVHLGDRVERLGDLDTDLDSL
ncbi:MAG TPA: FAD-dependent oxidoreductase [Solirubrobacteraceae bacterium]|nr:FAD-dependent oxidoreductase [Solirubrobacteraceae bacterium]